MSTLLRTLLILILASLGFLLFTEARTLYGQENLDPQKIVMLFAGVIFLGGLIALLVVTLVVPTLGKAIGNLFFNPNEKAPGDPHAAARALLARGEYKLAIEAFRDVFTKDQNDTVALSEIAQIYCEYLGDPAGAIDVLAQALERDWQPESASFLSFRLADVYWKYQRDLRSARTLLLELIDTLPGTKFAATAQQRLREIEHEQQQLTAQA